MEYTIKVPLLGFEHLKKLTFSSIDEIFATLTATPEGAPSFTLVNPYALQAYQFDIPQATQLIMDITSSSNILVYNIVVIHNPIEESTVNFLAPIIMNTDNHTLVQLILDSSKYPEYGISVPIKNFIKQQAAAV
ncbi:MAG: flagellar assembly protein FliW [Sulfuricurvum sp. PC08-66]|nr:MAG: flagellar assembly protein FliW [Sulfuricurvum sp. PC08-66]